MLLTTAAKQTHSSFITVYATAHFLIDAACAYLLLAALHYDNVLLVVILYNALAFAFQVPIGWGIDKGLNPSVTAITGLTAVALSYFVTPHPYVAVILAGLGNALFHAGGGSMVLSINRKEGSMAGIFVAPGAAGLAIGLFLSRTCPTIPNWVCPLILILFALLTSLIQTPKIQRIEPKPLPDKRMLLIMLCLLIPIALRSLIGLVVDFPWKQEHAFWIVLALAIVSGKVVGGILSDVVGLFRVGVGSLILSIPFMSFFSTIPLLGLLGVFLFNMTMPVTLIALKKMLPYRPGLTFGLTTLSLFVGALPSILGMEAFFKNNWNLFALLCIASILLYVALSKYKPTKKQKR